MCETHEMSLERSSETFYRTVVIRNGHTVQNHSLIHKVAKSEAELSRLRLGLFEVQ